MTNENYTETIEEDSLSAQFEQPERPSITLLESWREVLRAGQKVRDERIDMMSAINKLQVFPFLKLEEVELQNAILHEILDDALKILELEIESDPECLSRTAETDEDGEETDGEGNREHYLNLLLQWKKLLYEQEKDWSPSMVNAAPRVAAYINAAQMLLGEQGLVAHLDSIGFTFDEDDAALVNAGVYNEED